VAVDWQEPMVLQRKLRPSIAHVNVQFFWTRGMQLASTPPLQSTTPGLHPQAFTRWRRPCEETSDYSLLLSLSTSKGWKSESTWVAGYIPKQSAASGSSLTYTACSRSDTGELSRLAW